MNERKIEFRAGDRKLAGFLHLPEGAGPSPCVICSHGYKANKNSEKYIQAGWRFGEKGIAVLRFDHYGAFEGESDGKFEDANLTTRVIDLAAAISYLATVPEIDSLRLGLLGSSMGGMDVLLTQDKHVRAKVVFSTPFTFPRLPEMLLNVLVEKGYFEYQDGTRMNRAFFDDLARYDILAVIKKETCPVLVVHADLDEQVPRHHARVIYETLGSPVKQLQMIAGADHSFTGLEKMNEVLALARDWFEKYL